MAFENTANNLVKIPVVSHSSGSGALVLAVAGAQFPAAPFRITAITGPTYQTTAESLTIFIVTAVAVNFPQAGQCSLTVVPTEGTFDQAYSIADFAEMRFTAGTVSDLNTVVAPLQNQTPFTLVGNPTGTPGNAVPIPLGSGVSFVAGQLVASGGGGGGAGTVTTVSVVGVNGFTGTTTTPTSTPAISIGTSVIGILKGNGVGVVAGAPGTDFYAPGSPVALSDLGAIANDTVLANISGSTAAPSPSALTAIWDAILGSTQGSIAYRGVASWVALPPGIAGQVFATGGAGANPSWVASGGTGTVTTLGVATANGFSGTVANPTTTPVITIVAGAITPTSVAASGALSGSNLALGGKLTTAGIVTYSGAFATTWTVTGATAVTLPTSGTLLSTAAAVTVAQGGTGIGTATAYTVLCAGTTPTGNFQNVVSVGTTGQVLTSNGVAALPTFQTISGTGTVTTVSVASANGFTGTVASPTSTPVITVATSITGILKGNGTAISAATAGTDYVVPSVAALTSLASIGTVTVGTWNAAIIAPLYGGTGLGTLTAHAVMLGEGTGNVGFATIGTAGRVLVDQGTGNDPVFATTGLKVDSHYGAITADSDGATITFNLATSDWHTVTLGGNRTLAVSNATIGQQFALVLVQDGTGSRTIAAWFATIKWAGGSPPILTTTAGQADIFTFKCYGTNLFYGFVAGKNF